MKKRTKKSKKGFTLIELVVVIAILGILAAILVPVISGFIEDAKIAADNSNARLVYTAAAMYYSQNPEANASLGITELGKYLGASLAAMPEATSATFGVGAFTASVTDAGVITVSAPNGTYDDVTGKLVAGAAATP